MFKYFIWDFDGTLFDTYPEMSLKLQNALKKLNINVSKEEILQQLKVSVSHALNCLADRYALQERYFKELKQIIEDGIEANKIFPYPYVKEICELVNSRGGKNFVYTHRGDSTNRFLNYHGMRGLFSEVVTKEYGFKRKPDPEGFLYIINKYKLEKNITLAVGDRELDLLAAKNAGIKACFYKGNSEATFFSADFIVNSINELICFI